MPRRLTRPLHPISALLVAAVLVPAIALSGCGRRAVPIRAGQPGPAIAPAGALNAGGEPQWSAQVRGDRLSFSTGEGSALSVTATLQDHHKAGAAWSGPLPTATPDQPQGALTLSVAAKACVDAPTGMSYPLTAVAEVAGRRYAGCAAPAGQGLGPRT